MTPSPAALSRRTLPTRARVLVSHCCPTLSTAPWLESACITDSNITRPSALPSAASQARSGCGIRPTTLRRALQMPAMLFSAPLGLAASVICPRVSQYRKITRPEASSSRDDLGLRVVVALPVRDRHAQDLPLRRPGGERRVGLLDPDVHVLAVKLQVAVAQHRAGEESRLAENLEAVADAQDRPAGSGEVADGGHHRGKPGDRAGAQVVAVRKAARQHDDVGAVEARLLVPDELRLLPEHVLRGVIRVVIAVGSGKNDDAEFHGQLPVAGYQFPAQQFPVWNRKLATGNYTISTL